jgi:hypothetical protein
MSPLASSAPSELTYVRDTGKSQTRMPYPVAVAADEDFIRPLVMVWPSIHLGGIRPRARFLNHDNPSYTYLRAHGDFEEVIAPERNEELRTLCEVELA